MKDTEAAGGASGCGCGGFVADEAEQEADCIEFDDGRDADVRKNASHTDAEIIMSAGSSTGLEMAGWAGAVLDSCPPRRTTIWLYTWTVVPPAKL